MVCALLMPVIGVLAPAADAQDVRGLLRELNTDGTVDGTEASKSYKVIFDAYLDVAPPPEEISAFFNLQTVHPASMNWTDLSSWAESHPTMREAILDCKRRQIFGLPYGTDNVASEYRSARLFAEIAVDGDIRSSSYPWLDAMDVVALFGVAESYRLLESAQYAEAIDLMTALQALLRQCSDRIFLEEKTHSIELLIGTLSVFRDMIYVYVDTIPTEQLTRIARFEIPLLVPGRRHLFMPEGDRIVAEALLRSLIDARDGPDPEKFAEAFATIQSEDAPLTRFGAARRWKMIAEVHGSLEASLERLNLIYDDWYRRWQVQEYDPILDVETQFERTNPVRYSAVIFSMEDLRQCFDLRRRLIMEVNGTSVSAGLAAYRSYFGSYPDDVKKCYGQFLRGSINDVDPFDLDWAAFRYAEVTSDRGMTVDTDLGRLTIERGQGVLWSVGADHEDDRCEESTVTGVRGDVLIWPPYRALAREQNLVE